MKFIEIINLVDGIIGFCSPFIIATGIYQIIKKSNRKFGWILISIGIISIILLISLIVYPRFTAPKSYPITL